MVDWEAGKHDDQNRDWRKIIEDFRPPGFDKRVVLPAHKYLWYPEQGKGLADALQQFDGSNYKPVYDALMKRQRITSR